MCSTGLTSFSLRDTDDDGKADKREVILTGFGVQDSHLFPHQFMRAPGGWIWMAQGAFNYGKVRKPNDRPEKAIQFDQTRMARFRPDGSGFEITSQGPCNIWGLVINGEGEAFIQEANDLGYPVMPFHEYANYPGCSDRQWKSYAPEFPGTAARFSNGWNGLEWSCAVRRARGVAGCLCGCDVRGEPDHAADSGDQNAPRRIALAHGKAPGLHQLE
jgi:hypothetical protein